MKSMEIEKLSTVMFQFNQSHASSISLIFSSYHCQGPFFRGICETGWAIKSAKYWFRYLTLMGSQINFVGGIPWLLLIFYFDSILKIDLSINCNRWQLSFDTFWSVTICWDNRFMAYHWLNKEKWLRNNFFFKRAKQQSWIDLQCQRSSCKRPTRSPQWIIFKVNFLFLRWKDSAEILQWNKLIIFGQIYLLLKTSIDDGLLTFFGPSFSSYLAELS